MRSLPQLLLLFAASLTIVVASFAQQPPAQPTARAPVQNYGKLPLSFEANRGQTDAQVEFLSHGQGYALFFTNQSAVLSLSTGGPMQTSGLGYSPHIQAGKASLDLASEGSRAIKPTLLRMQLVGADTKTQLTADGRLPGTVNYFTGNDPAKWQTDVPTFERINYAGVYPGVNLVYYGRQRQLEFDFDVAPGADASKILLRFDGAEKLTLDTEGNLSIIAANGAISFHKPVVYQTSANNRREQVEGSFQILSRNTVSFKLGRYDRARALVIDPILNYSTYLGQTGAATAIAVDGAGAAYVTGWAPSGMPATGFQRSPVAKSNSRDVSVFVAKFNSEGTALEYCTYLSGSGDDEAGPIAVDSAGNAYVAGATSSPDFPITPGALQTKNSAGKGSTGASNITGFITKINSTGNALSYSTYLGGSAESAISGIAADRSGDAYVTGTTLATDFPTTKGAFQASNKASTQETSFVAKLDAMGSGLTYSTYLGGGVEDEKWAIAVDSTDHAYVAGISLSPDYPTTPGAFQTVDRTATIPGSLPNWTGVVTKINPSGTGLVYSTFLGGTYSDLLYAIALDASGDAFLTGESKSQDFPISPDAIQLANFGSSAFITKLNPAGSDIVYSTYLGGGSAIETSPPCTIGALPQIPSVFGTGIAVDGFGNAYITGGTDEIGFPVTASAFEITPRSIDRSCEGGSFLTKIDATGSRLLYSTYLSGSGAGSGGLASEYSSGIALDSSGDAYLAGKTFSKDFPTTPGAYQVSPGPATYTGGSAVVTKFNESGMTSLPVPTIELTSHVNRQTPTPPVAFTVRFQSASGKIPTGAIAFSFSTGPSTYFSLDTNMGPWKFIDLDPSGTTTYTPSGWKSIPTYAAVYYLGDAYNAPTSLLTETINTNPPLPVTIAITGNPNPAPYNGKVVFDVSVKDPSGKGIPAGAVTLQFIPDTSTDLTYASGTLDSSGKATLTVSSFPSGSYALTAPPGAYPVTVSFSSTNNDYAGGSETYTENVTSSGTTPRPVFSPAAGTYRSAQSVAILDSAPSAQVYYSDSQVPADMFSEYYYFSRLYTSPVQVASCETISAIAVTPGSLPSAVISARYVINASPGKSTPQENEWAWITGDCFLSNSGVYGQQGKPAAENTPGGRQSSAGWTDNSGNFWLFGGYGFDAIGEAGILNDLWKFNPSVKEWTWISGGTTFPSSCEIPNTSVFCSFPGVYGTLRTPTAENTPGSREAETTWKDNNGNLWLFGGYGYATIGGVGYNVIPLNDLWKFNVSTNQWAWMGGSSSVTESTPGVYGTLKQPATGNSPGSRIGAATWIDSNGNLWLFGGYGPDATGRVGDLNDVWKFNPSINQWAWMGGYSSIPQADPIVCVPCSSPSVPGKLRIPAAGNIPGGRSSPAIWTDKNGNIWLFGGDSDIDYDFYYSYGSEGSVLNDMWEFNPKTNEWAWMEGDTTVPLTNSSLPGVYGTLGAPGAANIPGGRAGGVTWTDVSDNLWLYSGFGFDSAGTPGDLNDWWRFDLSTNEWAWMGGSKTAGDNSGVYGTRGISAKSNHPGFRQIGETTWTDRNGNLWLFGGWGSDSDNTGGYLNDLWVFSSSGNEWKWMGGSDTIPNNGSGSGALAGIYNTPGVFAATNTPGGREGGASWTGSNGNFWLFGGWGYGSSSAVFRTLNDLWEFVPAASAPVPH